MPFACSSRTGGGRDAAELAAPAITGPALNLEALPLHGLQSDGQFLGSAPGFAVVAVSVVFAFGIDLAVRGFKRAPAWLRMEFGDLFLVPLRREVSGNQEPDHNERGDAVAC